MLKISIISPKISMSIIDKILEKNQYDCEFLIYTYDRLTDVLDIYNECKDIVDGIFFSGERGYIYLNQEIKDLSIPCKFIFYDTLHILSLFLNLSLDNPGLHLNRVYTDFLGPINNYYGVKDYLKKEHLPYFNESSIIDYEEMLGQATELWENKEIDLMLTRATTNLKNIEDSGIPFIHILPSEEVISNAIENAIDEIKLYKVKNSSKVICLIKPFYSSPPDLNQREYIEISMHKKLIDIKKSLKKNINITLISGRFELLFYDDEEDINLRKIRYIIEALKESDEFQFNLGTGISADFDNSRYLAEKALIESMEYGLNDGFAIDDNENIVGPLSQVNTLTYNANNPNVEIFAKENNIDISNVYRILGIYNKNKNEVMNSEILSKWLNITQRSCNRIIVQLVEHNLIKETNVEQIKGKGRPPKYYKFNKLDMDNMFFKGN